MNTPAPTRTRGQWYFVHFLALFTAVTTALYFWLQANFDLMHPNLLEPPPIPPRIALHHTRRLRRDVLVLDSHDGGLRP